MVDYFRKEDKHWEDKILTCGGANQLEPSGERGFDHLARVNASFCFAQVE